MTKVEVVVRGDDAAIVRSLFDETGVSGWTSVSNVSGFGHHGYHQGRLLFNDRSSLDLLITVVPDDSAGPLIEGLRELFESRPGVMFVSDTYVSRPDYFR